jgi:hypothetical protein
MTLRGQAKLAILVSLGACVCVPAASAAKTPPRLSGIYAAKVVSVQRGSERLPLNRAEDPWKWRFTPVTRRDCRVSWAQMRIGLGGKDIPELRSCLKRSGTSYTGTFHEPCQKTAPPWTLTVTVTRFATRQKKRVVTAFAAVATKRVEIGDDETGAPIYETWVDRWSGRTARSGEHFSSVAGPCANGGL